MPNADVLRRALSTVACENMQGSALLCVMGQTPLIPFINNPAWGNERNIKWPT